MSKAKEFINHEEMVRALMKSKAKIHLSKPNNGIAVPKSSGKKRKEERPPLKNLEKKGESQR